MIVTLDFETYFDQQITLKKLNYSTYVPAARPICVAFIYNNKLHFYHDKDIPNALALIPWNKATLVGHNLLFDGLVLKHHYGIQAHTYCDTLGLTRFHHPSLDHSLGALAERFCPEIPKLKENLKLLQGKTWDTLDEPSKTAIETYNKNDVLITAKLYDHFYPLTPAPELALIDHTIKLWLNPVIELDIEKAQTAIDEEKQRIKKQLEILSLSKEEIRSDRTFSRYLQAKGYQPPEKWSGKQQKTVPAFAKTDSAFLDFYGHNPELHELLDLKRAINSNIKESRTERLITTANENNGRIPIAYNYCGAFTHRFCLTGDTHIFILRNGKILDTILSELLPSDRVWDGENFVAHGGLVDRGIHEVITYDGITGTPDHRVFIEEIPDPIELREAAQRNYTLKIANPPPTT